MLEAEANKLECDGAVKIGRSLGTVAVRAR